jgi:hypothetical protein
VSADFILQLVARARLQQFFLVRQLLDVPAERAGRREVQTAITFADVRTRKETASTDGRAATTRKS